MKKENNTYDSRIAEKANTPLARWLQDRATNPKALAEYLGVSVQAVNQYKQGTAYPKTENLIKIAEYFQISVDYLLGFTDVPNRDTTIQAVCDYTGLSESAVKQLKALSDMKEIRAYSDMLSLILSDQDLQWFLGVLEGYLTEEKVIDTDLGMSRVEANSKELALFAASNGLRRIMDRVSVQFGDYFLTTEERLDLIMENKMKMKGETPNGKH